MRVRCMAEVFISLVVAARRHTIVGFRFSNFFFVANQHLFMAKFWMVFVVQVLAESQPHFAHSNVSRFLSQAFRVCLIVNVVKFYSLGHFYCKAWNISLLRSHNHHVLNFEIMRNGKRLLAKIILLLIAQWNVKVKSQFGAWVEHILVNFKSHNYLVKVLCVAAPFVNKEIKIQLHAREHFARLFCGHVCADIQKMNWISSNIKRRR